MADRHDCPAPSRCRAVVLEQDGQLRMVRAYRQLLAPMPKAARLPESLAGDAVPGAGSTFCFTVAVFPETAGVRCALPDGRALRPVVTNTAPVRAAVADLPAALVCNDNQ
jgi:hypothetical protein